MQRMGGGMRLPAQQAGPSSMSRKPQYVQPTGQFPAQQPVQPVMPPTQRPSQPMRPPMQQPMQPAGQAPSQVRSPFGGAHLAGGPQPAQSASSWASAPSAAKPPVGGPAAGGSTVLPGDEITSVLDEEKAFPNMGNDEQTTVLGPTLAVTLERQRTGETYRLDLPCVIGKGSAADCRIANNTAISRRHLRIMSDETTGGTPHIVVEDLGSLNKTRLNGDPISRGVPRALLDGDTLTMADETFVVHIHEE